MDVCILTAHPDDEIMFFLPTVLSLKQLQKRIHLLCVTSGDADGQGTVRRKELEKVAHHLQLSSCTILDDPAFPDSMTTEWNIDALKNCLLPYLTKLNVSVVYTFDEYGVSGHCNHIALAKVATLLSDQFCFFLLKSHSLVWKYCLVSKIYSFSSASPAFFLPLLSGIQETFQLMRMHKSQLTWFRYLYILFSCYTNINEFSELKTVTCK